MREWRSIAAIRAAGCSQKTVLCWRRLLERLRRTTHFRRCNLSSLLHQLILSPQIPNNIVRRMLPSAILTLMTRRLVHCMELADSQGLPRNVNHLARSVRSLIRISAISRCRKSERSVREREDVGSSKVSRVIESDSAVSVRLLLSRLKPGRASALQRLLRPSDHHERDCPCRLPSRIQRTQYCAQSCLDFLYGSEIA